MTEDSLPDNVLFDLYEQYIGEPETETDVYLGFGLFFVAISLAAVALLAFVTGVVVYGYRESGYFTFVEAAGSLGLLSLPLAMLSIVVLLPSERRATYGAVAGLVVTGAATVGFASYYPEYWAEFGSREMLLVVGTYAFGLALVLAATATSLVAHQIERVRAPAPSEIDVDPQEEPEETISDEQIERDIEQAMEDVDLTWGGVEQTEHRKLELNTDFVDDELQGGSIDVDAKTVVSEGTDSQVTGLKQMKGENAAKTATSESTVDDQTAALNELKQQKQEDQVPDNAPTSDAGLLSGVLSKLGLR